MAGGGGGEVLEGLPSGRLAKSKVHSPLAVGFGELLFAGITG